MYNKYAAHMYSYINNIIQLLYYAERLIWIGWLIMITE